MWKESIDLGTMNETIIKGEPLEVVTFHEVFANKKSVRQSEFYQAAVVGLKPELIFEVYSFEFDNEKKLRYPSGLDGKIYDIIRTYDKGEITELTVSAFVGGDK